LLEQSESIKLILIRTAEHRKHQTVIKAWIKFRDDINEQLELISECSSGSLDNFLGSAKDLTELEDQFNNQQKPIDNIRPKVRTISSVHDMPPIRDAISEKQKVLKPKLQESRINSEQNNQTIIDFEPTKARDSRVRKPDFQIVFEESLNDRNEVNVEIPTTKNSICQSIRNFMKKYKIPITLMIIILLILFITLSMLYIYSD